MDNQKAWQGVGAQSAIMQAGNARSDTISNTIEDIYSTIKELQSSLRATNTAVSAILGPTPETGTAINPPSCAPNSPLYMRLKEIRQELNEICHSVKACNIRLDEGL